MIAGRNLSFSFDENETDIAVAVSGGGDSMALVHMMCVWADSAGKKIHALTVDHGLRENAREEAEQVGKWLSSLPACSHHILTWDHDEIPQTAIMEQARRARYDLMASYCRDHHIRTLCVAHHSDDQVETFLFRLSKGSGIDGLAAMRPYVKDSGIILYRPLLDMSHKDLIDYCRANNLSWIEDPSNRNAAYARPRLRKALEGEGLTAKRMAVTVKRLARARDALEWLTAKALQECRTDENTIQWQVLTSFPDEIVVRVIQAMLIGIGKADAVYPPRMERVEDLIGTLRPGKSATLHNCFLTLSKDGKTLEIKGA